MTMKKNGIHAILETPNRVSQIWQPLSKKLINWSLGWVDYKTTKMSPLAQAMGQRFHFKVLLHKPNTVNLQKSFNQAWLKMLYYKVIAVNVVIHYKYIRHYAEKISEFFHYWKWAKEGSGLLYWLLSCTWNLSGSLMILRGYFGNFW